MTLKIPDDLLEQIRQESFRKLVDTLPEPFPLVPYVPMRWPMFTADPTATWAEPEPEEGEPQE